MPLVVELPVRCRSAPAHEPPFDDEMEPAVWVTADQLALDWAPGARPADDAARTPPPVHRTAVAGASADARLAVRRFVQLCVEVLNGYRPPAHLRRLARPSVAGEVVAQALVGAHRIAEARKRRRSLRRPAPAPVAVLHLRLCEPRPGAVEAAAALVTGDRTWAMAVRLELHREAWSATALRLI